METEPRKGRVTRMTPEGERTTVVYEFGSGSRVPGIVAGAVALAILGGVALLGILTAGVMFWIALGLVAAGVVLAIVRALIGGGDRRAGGGRTRAP